MPTTTTAIIIRRLTPAHRDTFIDLVGEHSSLGRDGARRLFETTLAQIPERRALGLVAENPDGHVIGFVRAVPHTTADGTPDRTTALLDTLISTSDHVAEQLVGFAGEALEVRGYERVLAPTSPENAESLTRLGWDVLEENGSVAWTRTDSDEVRWFEPAKAGPARLVALFRFDDYDPNTWAYPASDDRTDHVARAAMILHELDSARAGRDGFGGPGDKRVVE